MKPVTLSNAQQKNNSALALWSLTLKENRAKHAVLIFSHRIRPGVRGILFGVPRSAKGKLAVGSSERKRELRRRRHRQAKMDQLKRKAARATVSEKNVIAEKIRRLTPGSDAIIAEMGLEER